MPSILWKGRRTLETIQTIPCGLPCRDPPIHHSHRFLQDKSSSNHQRLARALAKIDSSFQEQMKKTSASLNSVGTTEEGAEDASTPIRGVKKNRDLAILKASDSAKVWENLARIHEHFLSEACIYEAIMRPSPGSQARLLTLGCPVCTPRLCSLLKPYSMISHQISHQTRRRIISTSTLPGCLPNHIAPRRKMLLAHVPKPHWRR